MAVPGSGWTTARPASWVSCWAISTIESAYAPTNGDQTGGDGLLVTGGLAVVEHAAGACCPTVVGCIQENRQWNVNTFPKMKFIGVCNVVHYSRNCVVLAFLVVSTTSVRFCCGSFLTMRAVVMMMAFVAVTFVLCY